MRNILFQLFCRIFSEDIETMMEDRENNHQAFMAGFDSYEEYVEARDKDHREQEAWEEAWEEECEDDQELPTYEHYGTMET